MGNSPSSADCLHYLNYITTQFQSIQSCSSREFVVLEELLELAPSPNFPIDLTDIWVLFSLDEDHSGRFTLDKCLAYAKRCHEDQYPNTHWYEIKQRIAAKALFEFYEREDGDQVFHSWIIDMLQVNFQTLYPKEEQQQTSLSIQALKPLHRIFSKQTQTAFPKFIQLLQQLELDIPSDPERIALPRIHELTVQVCRSFRHLMQQLVFLRE